MTQAQTDQSLQLLWVFRSPDLKAVLSGGEPPRLQPRCYLEVPREESAGLEAILTQS